MKGISINVQDGVTTASCNGKIGVALTPEEAIKNLIYETHKDEFVLLNQQPADVQFGKEGTIFFSYRIKGRTFYTHSPKQIANEIIKKFHLRA